METSNWKYPVRTINSQPDEKLGSQDFQTEPKGP